MLDSAHKHIKQVGKQLGLSSHQIDQVLKINAEHKFEVELDGKCTRPFGGHRQLFGYDANVISEDLFGLDFGRMYL